MNEHFIKNIEIKNFKCFENFKAEGFGRVNLIGGKNNVGKTAFMEALSLNIHSSDISTMTLGLMAPKYMRDRNEFIGKKFSNEYEKLYIESMNGYSSKSNINKVKFNVTEENGIKKLNFHFNKKIINVNINDFSYEVKKIPNFNDIGSDNLTNSVLKNIFESVQKNDQEELLNQHIQKFDKNIIGFKIIGGDKPQCKTVDGIYRDINEFGDGLKRFISTFCSLFSSKNGYLIIDEIENGIHYTNLDKLWEIILTISKEQNVQVFATTHSKECIESYARVAKKLKDEDITFIKMTRLEDGSIMAGIRDYETLQYAVEDGHEVRGW